jgi:hypothetical protein
MEEHVVFRGIIRNYRDRPVSGPEEEVPYPYIHQLHTLDDKCIGQLQPYTLLQNLDHSKSGIYPSVIPENRVVEIVIRVTDDHAAIGDDPWVYQRPHTYGPNSELTEEERQAIRSSKK